MTRLFFVFLFLLSLFLMAGCGDNDEDDDDSSSFPMDDDDDTPDDGDDDDDNDDNDTSDDDDNDDDNDDDTTPDLGLIPGLGEEGYDPNLEEKALRYAQQFHGICTVPTGLFLEAYIPDPTNRALVEDWLTNSEMDESFEEYSGVPVYDLMTEYGQLGDTNAFGGPAALGVTARYRLAKETKDVSTAEIIRAKILDMMESYHIFVAITGEPGRVARGIRPLDTPGDIPATVPLFDGYGNPLPLEKKITWRQDNSDGGIFSDYIWEDDVSKDQLTGFLLGMGAVWDAVADDPEIPQNLKTRMQEDAAAVGDMLMEVAPETGLDLCIRDADGRLTKHHDLNPLELEGVVLPPFIGNGFNALMAMSMFKTIAMITGEQRFKDFFNEMLLERDYTKYVDQTNKFSYTGPFTNWSNINMMYSSLYPLLRYEADPDIFEYWQTVMERDLWHSWFPGNWDIAMTHTGFYSIIWAAFAPGGADQVAAEWAVEDLQGFPWPPYWQSETINCDDEEIPTGQCLAVDGVTVLDLAGIQAGPTFIPFLGHLDAVQTWESVPWHVRPASNYHWRRSPHAVNADASDRLNPGGDFHAVYWLGRYLKRVDDPMDNVSPHAW